MNNTVQKRTIACSSFESIFKYHVEEYIIAYKPDIVCCNVHGRIYPISHRNPKVDCLRCCRCLIVDDVVIQEPAILTSV